jgi:TetR/AcrR family transcriptional repressor of mexJK operon
MANALKNIDLMEGGAETRTHPDIDTGLPAKALQVVEAARTLFSEQGFAAVSMDQVAKAAGVSKATVYAHFASKEQLFVAIVGQACRTYAETVMPEVRDAPDARTALIRIGRAVAGFLLAPRTMAIYRTIVAEGPRFPELARGYYDNGPRSFKRLLGSYLAEMTARGQLKVDNPRLAADLFCGMVRGPLYLQVLLDYPDPEAPDAETVVAAAVDMFLRRYGAD